MMKGTPFIYQGEEIGMTNAHFSVIEDYRDIALEPRLDVRRTRGPEGDGAELFGRHSDVHVVLRV
jgi:glycosidase